MSLTTTSAWLHAKEESEHRKGTNTSMNLVEAKKFVESAPQTLKENVTKEDAQKIKEAVEKAGGKIELA